MAKKIKIIFLSFYSGHIYRGMETVVHELASRLTPENSVSVYQAGQSIESQPYDVISLGHALPKSAKNSTSLLAKLFLDPHSIAIARFTLSAFSQLRKQNPDIIFVCNGGWQSLIIKFYCMIYGAKMVISGQAGLGWDDKWNLFIRPNLFIALTKRNELWAKKNGKGKIIRIPNGVDCQKFHPKGEKIKIDLPRPIMLCVAGPEKYKRVRETINAVKKLGKGSLLLVRQSVGADSDIEYGARELENKFKCMQFTQDQMPGVYRTCDLFTLVSEQSEAFGVSYLEAMASGLPVVATNDDLRREVIDNAGILVDEPINTENYAKSLETALSKQWGSLLFDQARRFDWNVIAEQYKEEFNKII